ncbi:hypothetical protein Ciccas_011053 [Cichlidogyrus casuarinus]|uniref:G-protein coupled receptors family 2 profile 2 domain-containing protein n=1 Tax=Cichlidogyrus casuarinus TaxID=1844966 RepID=A0ABD2PSS0_9PLAT
MKWPSYIGCIVCSISALATFGFLMKFKTTTNTSNIHKNLALATAMSQLSLLIGVDIVFFPMCCKIFSLLLHYSVLANDAWLMNEAFNLYILITYAAHSHSSSTQTGDSSMLRYYVMGWIPVTLAIFGTNMGSYKAENFCWISLKHIWLFFAPCLAINLITVLVLVFTIKEHRESAYTKDEKANQAISIQTRAIWSQVFLLSVSWAFGYYALYKKDLIVHFLFGFFGFIQGIFLFVFYFLLNDEVRSEIHKSPKYLLEYVNVGSSDEEDEEETNEEPQQSPKKVDIPIVQLKQTTTSESTQSADEAQTFSSSSFPSPSSSVSSDAKIRQRKQLPVDEDNELVTSI